MIDDVRCAVRRLLSADHGVEQVVVSVEAGDAALAALVRRCALPLEILAHGPVAGMRERFHFVCSVARVGNRCATGYPRELKFAAGYTVS